MVLKVDRMSAHLLIKDYTKRYEHTSYNKLLTTQLSMSDMYEAIPNPPSFQQRLSLVDLSIASRPLALNFFKSFIQRGRLTIMEQGGTCFTIGKIRYKCS